MYDNTIQSIRRALSILALFSFDRPRLGISEISRALNLAKGTVQGLVRTMTLEGFLQQDPETRKYELGFKIYELGVILAGTLEINQKAVNPAQQLARSTQRLVRVGILDKNSVLVTMDATPEPQPFLSPQLGPRAPLYCTAMGRAILAFLEQHEIDAYLRGIQLLPYTLNTITEEERLLQELEETRKRGYSINREEHLLGRAAIGAPIFGRTGSLAGSMCIVGDPSLLLGKQMQRIAKEVVKTSVEISQLMGFFHRPLYPFGKKISFQVHSQKGREENDKEPFMRKP